MSRCLRMFSSSQLFLISHHHIPPSFFWQVLEKHQKKLFERYPLFSDAATASDDALGALPVPSSSSVQPSLLCNTLCPLKQLCPTEERLLIFVQEKKRKSCIDCKVLCGIVFPTKSIVVILPSLHYATCLIISLEVAKTNKLESHFDAALIYINVEYTNHDISLSRLFG